MPETVIRYSDEIRKMAQPLIREHHGHLKDARIAFLLTSAKRTQNSKPVAGGAKKLSVEAKFFSSGMETVEDGFDFVVTFNEGQWRSRTDQQRAALLDHQLAHCGQKETVNRRSGKVTRRWVINPHDFEDFLEVVRRNGLYDHDIADMGRAVRQLDLPLDPEPAEQRTKRSRRRKTTAEPDGVVVSTELEESVEAAARKTLVRPGTQEALERLAQAPSEDVRLHANPTCAWVGCAKPRRDDSAYCEDEALHARQQHAEETDNLHAGMLHAEESGFTVRPGKPVERETEDAEELHADQAVGVDAEDVHANVVHAGELHAETGQEGGEGLVDGKVPAHLNDLPAEQFVPYEDRSSEELAAGHPDGDWIPEQTPFDDVAERERTEELVAADAAEQPREDDWKARAGIGTGRPRGRRDA